MLYIVAPPVKVSTDQLLDAVRALLLHGGPLAATARAVTAATGVSTGSLYHRFPHRDDLVAAAWLRAQDRFLDEFLGALGTGAGVEAAVSVLTWSAAHPDDAELLLRFALRDLLRGDVSPELTVRGRESQDRVATALREHAAATGRELADVTLALADLPYATTRRILRSGRPPSAAEVASLRRAATLLLG